MKNEKSEFHDDKVLAIYKKFKTVKKQEPITESKMGNSI